MEIAQIAVWYTVNLCDTETVTSTLLQVICITYRCLSHNAAKSLSSRLPDGFSLDRMVGQCTHYEDVMLLRVHLKNIVCRI